MKKTLRRLSRCTVALLVAGCSGGSELQVELRRIDATASTAQGLRTRQAAPGQGVGVNSDLSIVSLKVPIRSVTLSNEAGEQQTVYDCEAGSNDGCLVDLLQAGALEDLLGAQPQSVPAGTYNEVLVSTCMEEGKYTALVNASGKADPTGTGPTYYTQAGSGALTEDAAQAGEARVHFTGCTRRYPLPTPVTVADDGVLALKLYFDTRDIAYFGDAANPHGADAWYAGGYSYEYPNHPPGTYVGVNYLDVAGTVDAASPNIRRFRVHTHPHGSLGTVGLLFTSAGEYFGGFTRSFFSEETTGGANPFVTPVKTFTPNGDGTYTLSNYGSSEGGEGYFNTRVFSMAAATGLSYTDAQGTGGTYDIAPLH